MGSIYSSISTPLTNFTATLSEGVQTGKDTGEELKKLNTNLSPDSVVQIGEAFGNGAKKSLEGVLDNFQSNFLNAAKGVQDSMKDGMASLSRKITIGAMIGFPALLGTIIGTGYLTGKKMANKLTKALKDNQEAKIKANEDMMKRMGIFAIGGGAGLLVLKTLLESKPAKSQVKKELKTAQVKSEE